MRMIEHTLVDWHCHGRGPLSLCPLAAPQPPAARRAGQSAPAELAGVQCGLLGGAPLIVANAVGTERSRNALVSAATGERVERRARI